MKAMWTMVLLGVSAVAAAAPSASQEAVYRALSVRHPAPECAEVEALTDRPLEDLRYVVENADQPAWAGMRAAECLATRHAVEAMPAFLAWVRGDDTRGLAILVATHLDRMPAAVAREVGRAALDGPWEDDVRARMLRSDDTEIRAMGAK